MDHDQDKDKKDNEDKDSGGNVDQAKVSQTRARAKSASGNSLVPSDPSSKWQPYFQTYGEFREWLHASRRDSGELRQEDLGNKPFLDLPEVTEYIKTTDSKVNPYYKYASKELVWYADAPHPEGQGYYSQGPHVSNVPDDVSVNIPKPWDKFAHCTPCYPTPYIPWRERMELFEKNRKRDMQSVHLRLNPVGVAGIHFLEIRNPVFWIRDLDDKLPIFWYGVVINNKAASRGTNVVHSMDRTRIRMDSLVCMAIEVNQDPGTAWNELIIKILYFQNPEIHHFLGEVKYHSYAIMKTMGETTQLILHHGEFYAGQILIETSFRYGALGYGCGDQLKNTSVTVLEGVRTSFFPRVRPGPKDPEVRNHFGAIPFHQHSLQTLSPNNFVLQFQKPPPPRKGAKNPVDPTKRSIEFKSFKIAECETYYDYPVHAKLHLNLREPLKVLEPEWNDFYGRLLCVPGRRQRLRFFRKMLNGQFSEVMEKDLDPLWEEVPDHRIEQLIDAPWHKTDNQRLVYNRRRDDPPLNYIRTVHLKEEDRVFMKSFPPLARGPGWLAILFGYAPLEANPHHGWGVMDFPPPSLNCPKFPTSPPERRTPWERAHLFFWLILGGICKFFQFLIYLVSPKLEKDRDTKNPISVRLPSPAGSFYDLQTHYIKPGPSATHTVHTSIGAKRGEYEATMWRYFYINYIYKKFWSDAIKCEYLVEEEREEKARESKKKKVHGSNEFVGPRSMSKRNPWYLTLKETNTVPPPLVTETYFDIRKREDAQRTVPVVLTANPNEPVVSVKKRSKRDSEEDSP